MTMPKAIIIAAAMLSAAMIITTSFYQLAADRYEGGEKQRIWRVNVLTGTVSVCIAEPNPAERPIPMCWVEQSD